MFQPLVRANSEMLGTSSGSCDVCSLSLPPIRSLDSVQPKPHTEFMGAEEESATQICTLHRQLLQKGNGKSAKILLGKGWQ